jgi:hypothetical protein
MDTPDNMYLLSRASELFTENLVGIRDRPRSLGSSSSEHNPTEQIVRIEKRGGAVIVASHRSGSTYGIFQVCVYGVAPWWQRGSVSLTTCISRTTSAKIKQTRSAITQPLDPELPLVLLFGPTVSHSLATQALGRARGLCRLQRSAATSFCDDRCLMMKLSPRQSVQHPISLRVKSCSAQSTINNILCG